MNLDITTDVTNDYLYKIKEAFNVYNEKLKAAKDRLALILFIKIEFIKLAKYFIALGNDASKQNNEVQTYLVNYILSEDFKTVLILHRDVFLEFNKVCIYNQEIQVKEQQIANHFEQSKTILIDKLEDFQNILESKIKEVNNKKSFKNITSTVSLQKNPWEVYKAQYETIVKQFIDIDTQKVEAYISIATFNELKKVVTNVTNEHEALVDKISNNVHLISKITKENKDYSLLLSHVEDQLTQQSVLENNQNTFSDAVNIHINQLQKITIAIKTINGLLSIREVDLKRSTQKWFDYEILPKYMDLIGFETNIVNKYSLHLLNLKNSLQHSKERLEDTKFSAIPTTLTHVEQSINDLKIKSQIIANSLKDKVKNELLISNLIAGKPFLEVTLNSSLNVESSTILKKIKESFQSGGAFFNSQYKKTLQYKSLSNLEISTQCIVHRMQQDENTHYDSLFLNKNFIGDLFLVPRRNQENKLKLILDHWKQGFNKSVLVYGDRLSGRSTFLEYAASKFFGNNIVTLAPNCDAIIDGRKFKTTNNLKEALHYVKNNNIKSTKPIILIDDLELWRDDKNSFLNNIRALINFIETESDNAFVMATTTQMMANHLDNRLNFSNAFSDVIDVNQANENEIANAIILRHGAAHRDIVSKKLEPISNNKLRIIALKLSKENSYNLGNTLQSWTYNTHVQENQTVVYKDSNYEFLDFFTSEEIIILKQALIFTFISEYSIKNVTTTSFISDFKSALRRLLNVKILVRHLNGYLYINPVVVNDITKIINSKMNS
ncbi:MAG: hypothetical protein NWQ31_01925 [Polaribacter sp.]|nr:hypothetical protein [Polaribacter sp.]|tara:strand:+ start:43866 stop:46202 length:2337 start_codon:yes stop_codon:yes gene_type:complete